MDPDDGMEDEGPFSAWLPPDDRLWRHPSEMGGALPADLDPTHDLDAVNDLRSLMGFAGSDFGTPDIDATHDFDAHLGVTHSGLSGGGLSADGLSNGDLSGGGISTLVRNGPVRTWTLAVVAGLVGALLASGVSMATGNFGHHSTPMQNITQMTPSDTVALAVQQPSAAAPTPNWPPVASSIAASVVAVLSSSGVAGSGVLYKAEGGRSYILTTDDLVTGHVQVTFNDGEQQSARVVDTDPVSGLALLSVSGEQRAFPSFGSVSDIRTAEPLLAVSGGEPSGSNDSPLSVTAVDDAATISDDQTLVGMLAVTGAAPTAEGSALVDPQGNVIGITTSMTATDPSEQGTSYAIPIDLATHVAQQLLYREAVTHPYLGVLHTEDLSSVYARQLGIGGGALVETVAPGSPAAKAGITQYDVITGLGDSSVTSAGSLLSVLCDARPGTSVTVRYLHQGKPASATVKVAEQPTNVYDPSGD